MADYLRNTGKYPKNYLQILDEIRKEINDILSKYPNFNGIDYCDVSAGGIQIRLFHKEVKGYAYGDQVTLKYDLSNADECVDRIVRVWEYYDTPENLKRTKSFIADGEKYGWD